MTVVGDTLVTGEAVAVDLQLARLPSRLLAGGIDLAVLAVAVGITVAAAAGTAGGLDNAAAAALTLTLSVAIVVGYPAAMETLWRGRTLGKAAIGLRVVRDDGGPVRFWQALVRALAGAIVEKPGLLGPFTLLVGMVTMMVNQRGKRLGDLLAGTVVLQERTAARGGPVAEMPAALAGWAATLDLTGLTDDLALAVRQFVARAPQLAPGAREDMGRRLTGAVVASIRPGPPPGTPGWAVLAAVLAERRRRAERGPLRGAAGWTPAQPGPGPVAAPTDWPPAGPTPGPPTVPGRRAAVRPPAEAPDTTKPPEPGPGGFVLPS